MPNDQDIIQRLRVAIHDLGVATVLCATDCTNESHRRFVDERQAEVDAIITEVAAALAAKETT